MEVTERRNELTHLSRVAMLGELSGSLAHELNQPLAAILSNAQAALALIGNGADGVGEARSCLDDIVRDNGRAGEIIARLRALAKNEPLRLGPLDLSSILRDVRTLVQGDALLHGVEVTVAYPASLPMVQADRVGLQQVLLNLLLNAFSAMANAPADRKEVNLSARVNGDGIQ